MREILNLLDAAINFIDMQDDDPSIDDVRAELAYAIEVAEKVYPTTVVTDFPEVVCLCGSTKFKEAFVEANYRLTWEGKIVLSVASYAHADGGKYVPSAAQKIALDALHKEKIRLADRVLVLNVGGYWGESTQSEIDFAVSLGKPVEYLENKMASEGAAA